MNAAALKRWMQSLGLPGIAGALALLLAVALLLLGHGWDSQAAGLQTEADALRRSLRAQRATAVEAPPVTPQQWQAQLPPAAERQQRLADLLEMGLRAGLASSRTEHRLTLDAASGLERLRISMPVNGGYAQLRQFIGAALAHDPALSLDSLKLRRTSPMAAEVEAELVWSLHSRIEVQK
jgi:Tfp pilus assembly protein PilO